MFKRVRMICFSFFVVLVVINITDWNNSSINIDDYISYKEDNKELLDEMNKEDSEEVIEVEDEEEFSPLEVLVGSLSLYGPDCYGCTSNKTASGMYVGDGNIYYKDSEYGTVRIVAADKSYPFGTIVRVSNVDYFGEPIYAIVLDRGGDIGKNRRFLFDLLFPSEREANSVGSRHNVTFEIMRLGY